MTLLTNFKKLGVNTTVLATSISLVACGGGGSDGYYSHDVPSTGNNNNGSGSNAENSVKEATAVKLELSKSQLDVKGDELTITATAVDEHGGGVSGKKIILNIANAIENGLTSDNSSKETGASGSVTFTVKLDGSNKSLTSALFIATIEGTTIQDTRRVEVSGAGTVVPSQYELKFDEVPELEVTGGESTVRVRALDLHGGSVSNENITLSVKDFLKNNVTIKGGSTAKTDANGYAEFEIELAKGSEANRQELLKTGIELNAILKEASGAAKAQTVIVGVKSVANLVSSLKLETSKGNKVDAVGGMIEVTAIATNPEGLPVSGQEVSLSLDDLAKTYGAKLLSDKVQTDAKGRAVFTIKTEANSLNKTGELLVANGISVSADLIASNGQPVRTQKTQISVVSTAAEEISFLKANVDKTINISGGSAKVTVTAVDKNGGAIANKLINLSVKNSKNNGITIVQGSQQTTNEKGEAQFTLQFNNAEVSQADLDELLKNGTDITAVYIAQNNNTISQTTKLSFFQIQSQEIVQRLELQASKGVVSSVNDTVQIKARALNADGKPLVKKLITIGLNLDATENGVTVDGKVTAETDSNGYALFTLRVNAQNKDAVAKLVSSGIAISVLSNDGAKQNMRLMVEESAIEVSDVSYLSMYSSGMIDSKGGETTVTVKAVDSNGGILKNQNIVLKIKDSQKYGLTIKNGSSQTTGETGEAAFTLVYDGKTVIDPADLNVLLNAGALITASFTANNKTVSQTSHVQYYINSTSESIDIQRLDITAEKNILVLNALGEQKFKAVVTLKDQEGRPVSGRKVTLGLDAANLQNGVSFTDTNGGTKVVATNAAGEAVFDLVAKPQNREAINALAASGINLTATALQADGLTKITQITKVTVVSAVAVNEVSYLVADQGSAISTLGGETYLTVGAYNSKGDALAGKAVELQLTNVPAGLIVKLDQNSVITDANGKSKFKVIYTAPSNLSANQIKGLLEGINAAASYKTDAGVKISQNTTVHFYVDQKELAEDIQRIELTANKGIVSAENDTITLTMKAVDKLGNLVSGKYVTLGIDSASLQNGVTFEGAQAVKLVNGLATFTIKVNGSNEQMIQNLVANGITLSAAAILSDGNVVTQTTRVMAKAPEAVDPAVSALQVTLSKASVSVLGDSTVVGVRAVDANGKGLVNKTVAFALGPNTSGRVSADKTSAVTNSDGYAYFTVKVSDGNIDETLLKNSITFAVTTFNADSPTPKTQIGRISVFAPQEATNITTSASKEDLLISGDTAEVYAKLADQSNTPIKGYPVAFTVLDGAMNGAVIINGSTATDDSGNAKATLQLNAASLSESQRAALLSKGISVRATIQLANGVSRTNDIHFKVNEAVNPNHLDISSSRDNLSINGDKAVVTVSLLSNQGNTPVANQQVTLKVKKTASTTGTNIGIVTEENSTGSPGAHEIRDTWTVTTDSLGRAFFTINIPEDGFDKDALIASGIELEASNTAANGAVATQIHRLTVNNPVSTEPRYNLRISSVKPVLNVQDDSTDVTVTLLDQNGGAVEGKYITLNISKFNLNGASIIGASGRNTNEFGQAVFKVKIDGTARNQSYTAAEFAADDLNLTATFATALQTSRIDVIQAPAITPAAAIVIAPNPIQTASSEGIYYIRNLSVSVVDANGKPLKGKQVNLNISPTSYVKGSYSWSLVTDMLGNQREDWVYRASAECPVTAPYNAISNAQVTNIPLIVPTFLVNGGQSANFAGTTDADGKFDFSVRYPKIYAQWLNVRIEALSADATMPTRTFYDLGLSSIKDDYSTDGSYTPNGRSPYGTLNNCAVTP